MLYVDVPSPVTVNLAALTVPVTAGRVTPPVFVRLLDGSIVTVPGIVELTANVPKFNSTEFEIVIGCITVADDFVVAVDCSRVDYQGIEVVNLLSKSGNVFKRVISEFR